MSPYVKYETLLMCNNVTVCHVFKGFSSMVTDTVFYTVGYRIMTEELIKSFFFNIRLEIR